VEMAKRHFISRQFVEEHKCSIDYLMHKYHIARSTAYKWRKAVENHEGHKIERDFKLTGRILGILWALGRDDGERFLLTYRDKAPLEEVTKTLGINNKVSKSRSRTGEQYRLRVSGDARDYLKKELARLGWRKRWSEERPYPENFEQHRDFILAYIELHSSLDRNSHGKPRLRIYGNKLLMQGMNEVLPKIFDVHGKTPQKVTAKTYALYFQSPEEVEYLMAELRGAQSKV